MKCSVMQTCNLCSLPSRTTNLHPLDCLVDDFANTLLHQRGLRQVWSIGPKVRVVVVQHQPIDVDLRHSRRHALLQQLGLEAVGAVKHKSYTTIVPLSQGFKSALCKYGLLDSFTPLHPTSRNPGAGL
jgi:hypothetical protein